MNGRASYLLRRKRCFSKSQRCSTERKRTLLWSYLARICKTCCRSTGTSQLQMFGPKKLGIDIQLKHILWLPHRLYDIECTNYTHCLRRKTLNFDGRVILRGTSKHRKCGSHRWNSAEPLVCDSNWSFKFVSLSNERILNWILLY